MTPITMTYKQQRELTFAMQTIGKIFTSPMKGKTSLKLKKIFDQIIMQGKIIQKEGVEALEGQFAKRDEQGNIVRPPNDEFGFEVDEAKAEDFRKARDEFEAKEFTLNRPKLPFAELEGLMLTVQDISVLEPILDLDADEAVAEKATPALRSV